MVKKKNSSNRKRTRSTPVKRRVVRITSNPFLNFFLSVCKIKGNKVVEKIAKNAAVEWRRMNYLDKTPYYLLADEAKKRKKKCIKKKEVKEEPSMVVPRKRSNPCPLKMKSDTEIDEAREKPSMIRQRRKSEGLRRKKSVSSMGSEAVVTSDCEGIENHLDTSERDLRRRKFWPGEASESSFGLSTSISGNSLVIHPYETCVEIEDMGENLHSTFEK